MTPSPGHSPDVADSFIPLTILHFQSTKHTNTNPKTNTMSTITEIPEEKKLDDLTTGVPGVARPLEPAHIIQSDSEAIEIAERLAADFAKGASERDLERKWPVEELDAFSQSGLWSINVPRKFGGPELSYATLSKVIEIISAADPSSLPSEPFPTRRSSRSCLGKFCAACASAMPFPSTDPRGLRNFKRNSPMPAIM